MKLVLLLTIIWAGLTVLACGAVAGRADRRRPKPGSRGRSPHRIPPGELLARGLKLF